MSTSLLCELVTQRCQRLRGVTAVVLAAVSLIALASCDGSTSTAQPLASASGSSSSPVAETSATPSETPTGWQSEYTPEQITEYEQALSRWEDYERESAPLWADPEPSGETLSLFKSYFYTPEQVQDLLKRNQQVAIKIEGVPAVLWSRAVRIKESALTFRQCIDLSSQSVTQYGRPTSGRPQTPRIRDISMSRPNGGTDYLISNVTVGNRSCQAK